MTRKRAFHTFNYRPIGICMNHAKLVIEQSPWKPLGNERQFGPHEGSKIRVSVKHLYRFTMVQAGGRSNC